MTRRMGWKNGTEEAVIANTEFVIPANAGIQLFCNVLGELDSGFRRNDDKKVRAGTKEVGMYACRAGRKNKAVIPAEAGIQLF